MYRARLHNWFNVHFQAPTDLPEEVLRDLTVAVTVTVGESRTVLAFEVEQWSDNSAFDRAVQTALEKVIGKQVPPAPPLLSDFIGEIDLVYTGNSRVTSSTR